MTAELRALTVQQPWAAMTAHGGKTVENRTRGMSYRGLLAIHAGMRWSDRGGEDPRVYTTMHRLRIGRRNMQHGCIIAVADLVDSHPDGGCCRPWGESVYDEHGGRTRTTINHLILENVRPLESVVHCKGALGLWKPAPDIAAEVLAAIGEHETTGRTQ